MPQARILYLEDDHSLGLLCSEVLVKAGYSVCWKHDGISGLRALQNGEFDIGVVDIMMPDMDGYAFLKELRELSNYMPVILVSARVMTEDVLRGFDLGADDYMRKPFSIEELIVRINRLLKDRKAETDTDNKTIRIGKYLFMPSMLQLKIGDEVIELSPRTCAILLLAPMPLDEKLDELGDELSDEDLSVLLKQFEEDEDYEICQAFKIALDERKSKNSN